MTTTTYRFVFTKDAQRHLNERAIINNNEHILGTIGKSMAANGWSMATDAQPDSVLIGGYDSNLVETANIDDNMDRYHNTLHFTVQHIGQEMPSRAELRGIAKQANTRSTNPLGGRWTLDTIDGIPYETAKDGETLGVKDFTAYADFDLPEHFEDAFEHLYGLDSHIQSVKRALEVGRQSQFTKRYHVALIGPPGCGKSDICETLADLLGTDAVMKFDGTATTAAGAIKQIDEAEIMPRILIVEEIEKVAPEALSYLLGVMDLRGEIRKTTAKSKIVKDTKILVIATINNYQRAEEIHAGALWSRFSRKVWFHRPTEEVQRRILAREIGDIDGDEAWIDPVIEYAREKNITDPRMLAALALCGQDGWLDGSFLKELSETDKPQDY